MSKVKAYAAHAATTPLIAHEIERRLPKADDVVIDLKYCGICHTDIHISRDGWGGTLYPLVPGHEMTGIVTAIGETVTKFKVGDRVGIGCFVDGGASIGACDAEHEQYHPQSLVITYGGHEHDGKTVTYGGYSQSITVKENYVLRIPDALPLESAAPLLCAGITLYSALRHWNAGPGQKVGIIGLGGLGHIGVKIAHAMGADVTVLGQTLSKAEDGRAMGAKDYRATSDPATFSELARSFDLLINTVGAPIDWNAYVELLKVDGTMIQVGVPEEQVPVQAFPLILGRRSISGSSIGSIRETQEMLDFCAEHSITADVEIIPIQQVNEAYERVLTSDVRYRFVIDLASLETVE